MFAIVELHDLFADHCIFRYVCAKDKVPEYSGESKAFVRMLAMMPDMEPVKVWTYFY